MMFYSNTPTEVSLPSDYIASMVIIAISLIGILICAIIATYKFVEITNHIKNMPKPPKPPMPPEPQFKTRPDEAAPKAVPVQQKAAPAKLAVKKETALKTEKKPVEAKPVITKEETITEEVKPEPTAEPAPLPEQLKPENIPDAKSEIIETQPVEEEITEEIVEETAAADKSTPRRKIVIRRGGAIDAVIEEVIDED